jgi:pilus assembly protein Flp/PilA
MNAIEMYRIARSLVTDKKGVTALEYGLIASLIAAAIVTGVALVGTNAAAVFTGIAGRLVAPAAP